MTPKFIGNIKQGKLNLINEQRFKEYLQTIEGEVEIVVRKKRKAISTPQMRYYYGVIVKILSTELGYSSDEMDAALKFKFKKQYDVNGLVRIPSKLEFNTSDTENWFSEIRMWASSQLNINIPLPNEVEYDN